MSFLCLQYMLPVSHPPQDGGSATAPAPHHLGVAGVASTTAVQTTPSPGAGGRNQPRRHHFAVRTFSAPIKCNHCTSLMVGATRQGTVCEDCAYSCHTYCAERAPQACPVPPDQSEYSGLCNASFGFWVPLF